MRLPIIVLFFLLFFGSTSFQKAGKKTPAPEKKTAAKSKTTTAPGLKMPPPPHVWLEVEPKKDDSPTTLLNRYDLKEQECNEEKFYELNKMTVGQKLKPGKPYKLPILIVKYDGKSIRTTLKTSDLQLAMRLDGYNKAARKSGLRDDNFIESKNLWVPYHEFGCPAEGEVAEAAVQKSRAPETPVGDEKSYLGNRIFPIFGEQYQKTPLLSRKLKGKIFYIVSGHGGPDVGAQGQREGHTLCEDEYAYDVSLRLLRLLVSHGATAYMIVRDPDDGIRDESFLKCDSDETVWGNLTIPRDQKKRLFQRSDLVNSLTASYNNKGVKDQTFIEIHVDSRTRNKRTDVFFYYRDKSESSEKLARAFHNSFKQKYLKVRAERHYTGTVSARGLHMLRETTTPTAVYIELGNIRNTHDQQRLVLKKNREAVAKWLFEPLLEGLN